jgi:hypothetical protein
MTRKILAWSLLCLASSPFTAPFSTCDLATLFGHATGIALNAPVVQASPHKVRTIVDDDALAVSSLATAASRTKLLPIAVFGLKPTSSTDRPDGADSWAHHPTRLPDEQPDLSTILRL